MQLSPWTASIVPFGADQTLYVVVDRINGLGRGSGEAEVERTDFDGIVADLLSGRFNDPVRVIAFNTLEHWSEDVSAAIASEIRTRADIDGEALPEHLEDFVRQHEAKGARGSRLSAMCQAALCLSGTAT